MSRTRLLVFVVVPVTTGLVLQAMYFSGVAALEQLIVPEMEGMHLNTWREFGLLESLQNLLLLGIIGVAVAGVLRVSARWQKAVFGVIAAFAAFIFLEEIDYGLHYYEYVSGIESESAAESRNWHNVGKRTSIMKRLVDAGAVLWFFVVPLATARVRAPKVRYFLPSRWYAVTVVCAWLLSELAHLLNDAGLNPDGNIRSNISEFREINTYYLPLVYLSELVFVRDWPSE